MKALIGREITEQDKIKFKAIFKKEIVYFMNPVFGFDIFGFDKYIQTPDGKSTSDWLTEKYGKKAEQFIRGLI